MGTNLFYTKKKIIDIFDQIYNSNDQGKRGYPLTARGWKCENRPELTMKLKINGEFSLIWFLVLERASIGGEIPSIDWKMA